MTKKISFIFIIIILFISFISLDYLVNWDLNHDPTKRIKDVESNLSDYEMEEDLSGDIFYEDEEFIFYTDRIVKRFDYDEENIINMASTWEKLSKNFPKDVNTLLVPIPSRIIFEKEYDVDKLIYDEFYQKFEASFMGLSRVLDLRDIFDLHKDEYIFYRTSDSITSKGGYYASKEVYDALDGDFHIPISDYHQHMYRRFDDKMDNPSKMKISKNTKEYNLFQDIPEDLTYYYLLGTSKNVCEVFRLDTNSKISSTLQPTLVKSGIGSGAIIGASGFQWALVQGEGLDIEKKDKTLLFISDESGKHMLQFLLNYYKSVYYIDLKWNKVLDSDLQKIEDIFKNYDISDIVFAQRAGEFGYFRSSSSFKNFENQEEK